MEYVAIYLFGSACAFGVGYWFGFKKGFRTSDDIIRNALKDSLDKNAEINKLKLTIEILEDKLK